MLAPMPPTPPDPTLVPDDWWDHWARVGVLEGSTDALANIGCALTDSGGLYCWDDEHIDYFIVESGVTDFSVGAGDGLFWIQDGQVKFEAYSGLDASSFPSLDGDAIAVEGSESHTCALMADGTIACNDADLEAAAPAVYSNQGDIPTGTFTQISVGYYVNCGVRTDGTLACWGGNDTERGGGVYYVQDVPAGTFTQVSVSPEIGCAVRTDGCIVCWSSWFSYDSMYLGYNPTEADPLCYSGQALTLGE